MTDTGDTRSWWPEGYDLPAFRVKRRSYGLASGGDYVRGSSMETLPHTALRYASSDPDFFNEAAQRALIFTRPFDYHTVEILWGWPEVKTPWLEVALVRSSFGHPATPRDGETVFRSMRSEFETLGDPDVDPPIPPTLLPPPIVYDQPLPAGNWYYYSLFYRTNPIDWVLTMQDACMLPRDYLHREHMWNAIPPYYQWIDDNYRVGAGHLRQFLTVFGFEMDHTRGFVEGVLDLHYIDRTPMQLLKGLGANYGLPYESGIGDIRYRGLVANIKQSQHTRGTAVGLQKVIEAVSKYQTSITDSSTLMLTPDDSDFHNSTGNWGPLHPYSADGVLGHEDIPSLPWQSIYVARVNKPAPVGRGVMRVYTDKANELEDVVIVVADARIRADGNPMLEVDDDTVPETTEEYRDAIPLETGISIQAGLPYAFSVWVQAPEANFTVQAVLVWFGPSGNPKEVLDVDLGLFELSNGTDWKQFIAQGIAPVAADGIPEAWYLAPGIRIYERTAGALTNRSAAIDICGSITYLLGDEDSAVSVIPPDRYLTLGDPSEKIGVQKEGFEGYIMGAPQQRSARTAAVEPEA